MTMQIKNGRIVGAKFVQANSFGGTMVPTLLVVHDTAGRLDKFSSVNWFASKQCTTSAHVVVERDGTITQMVPFNRRAWHAGQSQWQGKKLCNSFAIGIEIVNPGLCGSDGRAWFHKKTEPGFDVEALKHVKTKEHGDGWWMPYTPEQIKAVKDLCRALIAEYPDVNDIATHWQVSPGRKVDTSPVFPLEEVEAFAFGHAEPEAIDVPPVAVKPALATAKDLRKVSRKFTLFAWVKRLAVFLGIGTGGSLTLADVTEQSKGLTDVVSSLVANPVLLTVVAASIAVVAVVGALEALGVIDYNEGRWTPSGAE